jgi:hypothetical protein
MPNGEINWERVKSTARYGDDEEFNAGFRLSWNSPDEYRTQEEKAFYTDGGTWYGYRAGLERMARRALAGDQVEVPVNGIEISRGEGFAELYADSSSARINPPFGEGQPYDLAA